MDKSLSWQDYNAMTFPQDEGHWKNVYMSTTDSSSVINGRYF